MEIYREFTFEAAHRLPQVPAGHKCARLHGHSYRVEIHLRGDVDETTGWVLDFGEISAAFRPLHDQLRCPFRPVPTQGLAPCRVP